MRGDVMNLSCTFTGDPLTKQLEREARALKRGVKQSVSEATGGLKANLRADVIAAGLGTRVANTWRSNVYPAGQDSARAASLTFTKAPNIIDAFSRGVTITGKHGPWLAIPTPNAPKRINGKKVRPDLMEGKGYHFKFVKVKPTLALLIAVDVARSVSRKTGASRYSPKFLNDRRRRKGVDVVMFWLVRGVTIPKKLDLEGRANEAQAALAGILTRRLSTGADA